MLNGVKKFGRFDKGLGAQLPEAYRKFWREWRESQRTAVHYIPKEGKWNRDELTGEMRPIQNIAVPMTFPRELNEGIWGGEAVLKGFQKRTPYKRRVPHFWVPVLRRTVVKSDILNVHLSTVVTDRTLALIHECQGFDHYILKTPACDLQSTLALALKRKMLIALKGGCTSVSEERRGGVLSEYKQYLEQYSDEEVEWYGLTYKEAIEKIKNQIEAQNEVVPHKILFRQRLIEQLKETQNRVEGQNADITQNLPGSQSWLAKINPFKPKKET